MSRCYYYPWIFTPDLEHIYLENAHCSELHEDGRRADIRVWLASWGRGGVGMPRPGHAERELSSQSLYLDVDVSSWVRFFSYGNHHYYTAIRELEPGGLKYPTTYQAKVISVGEYRKWEKSPAHHARLWGALACLNTIKARDPRRWQKLLELAKPEEDSEPPPDWLLD